MAVHRLTRDDLRQHLKEHMDWLDESMRSFDAGKEHSSKRLAHTIRSLVHDTAKSHSLLGQLGVKQSLQLWSVLPNFGTEPTTEFMGVSMAMSVVNGEFSSRYAPNLGAPEQRLPFDQWWDGEQIIVHGGEVVTRRRAVLALANKDGGSHVDAAITDLEHKLLRTDVMGWKTLTITGGQEYVVREERLPVLGSEAVFQVTRIEGSEATEEVSDLSSPIRAAVRQISHELSGTVREQLAALLS
jgi:hypothetical protein